MESLNLVVLDGMQLFDQEDHLLTYVACDLWEAVRVSAVITDGFVLTQHGLVRHLCIFRSKLSLLVVRLLGQDVN